MKRHRYQIKGEVAKQDNTAVNTLPLNIKEEERDEFGRSYPVYQDPGTINESIQLNPNLGFTRRAGESPQMSKYKEDVFNDEVRNAFIDAGIGSGVSKTARLGKNAYKLNPWALKKNPETFLYRAQKVGQDPYKNMAAQLRERQAAGEQLKWYQKNLLNPQTDPSMIAREKYYGQWFENDPSRLPYYLSSDKIDDAGEVLRMKLPKSELSKSNVSNFDDAKILTSSPETEFILPKSTIESAERFPASSLQKLIQEDKAFNTPHWLKGYKPATKYRNKGRVKYQTKGTVEGRARDRFKSYLMEQEAGRDYISRKRSDTPKPGGGYYKQYEGDRYYPYKMPSEEHYTVGYGHYGPDAKGYTKGIDEEQARNFLEKDMDNAVRLAGIYVDENKKSPYSSNPNKSFKDLDSHTKYMLADYPYNLGKLSKFPKFTEAVLTGDTTTAREQYLRYDKNNRPIVKRNEAFSETFLEPWVERQRNSNQVKLPYKPYPLRVPPRGAGGTWE